MKPFHSLRVEATGWSDSRSLLVSFLCPTTYPKFNESSVKCPTMARRQSYSVMVCDGAEVGKYAQLVARV